MIRLVICLACIALCASCHSNVSVLNEAQQTALSVEKQFVPDSREGIYKVALRTDKSALIVSGETTSPEAKKALLSRLTKPEYTIIDSLKILPDCSSNSKCWGLVNLSVCNMRSNPGHDAEMVSQAILGTPVRILKNHGHWLLLQTPDRYIGWVDDDAVVQADSAGMASWKGSKRIIYLPASGTGYDPSTKEAVTDIVAGSILKLADSTTGEYILEMPDGRKIAIPKADGTDFDQWRARAEPSPALLSQCAKTLMGRPYLWGGTSTKGIDCSGFVKTVYFLNGIILARDASLQFRHGAVTDPKEGYTKLKEGDLIFFGRKADGQHPAKATHVGFYLGNGAYIHSSGFVRVNSFDPEQKNFSKTRADNWLGGRSILGSEGNEGIVRVKDHPWY